MIRRAAALLAVLLVTLLLAAPALAVPRADPAEKVYDYAGLLTREEIAEFADTARTIAETHKMDIGVVTVDDNEGLRAQAYIDDFYDYNGFGVGSGDDGMLLLIDMDGREISITTYGLAQRTFYDRDIDRLLDAVYDQVSRENYGAACRTFLVLSEQHMAKATATGWSFGTALVTGLVLSGILVVILVILHRSGMKSAPAAQAYLAPGSLRITHTRDDFLHTHTARVPIPKSTSSGGGGGGGSTHRSSSGRSHGGGSRRF